MNPRTGRFVLIWILILATIYLGDRFVRDVLLTAEEPHAVTARGTLAEAEQSAISLFERAAHELFALGRLRSFDRIAPYERRFLSRECREDLHNGRREVRTKAPHVA